VQTGDREDADDPGHGVREDEAAELPGTAVALRLKEVPSSLPVSTEWPCRTTRPHAVERFRDLEQVFKRFGAAPIMDVLAESEPEPPARESASGGDDEQHQREHGGPRVCSSRQLDMAIRSFRVALTCEVQSRAPMRGAASRVSLDKTWAPSISG
jgi:hypothetical protein